MTWNVNFEIKDGKVAPESVTVGGTAPDGFMSVQGYETEQGRSLGVTAGRANGSFYMPKPVAPKPVAAEVAAPEATEPAAPPAPVT